MHVPMLELDERGNARETAFLAWLRETVADGDFRLVILDPLSRFAGPEAERDNAAATRFVEASESLLAPTRSVLVAHHTNQTSRSNGTVDATAGRGVTGLVDGPRWQCALSVESLKFDSPEEAERLGEVVTFKVTKSNYARKPAPIVLRRDLEHGGALRPVDEADLERIKNARSGSGERAAKHAEKQAERAADIEQRERLADEKRQHSASVRAAEAAQRREHQEQALLSILRAHPNGLTVADVEVKLKNALGALTKGEHNVIADRLGNAVARTKAPPPAHHSAVLLRLVETELTLERRLSPVSPVTSDRDGLSPEGDR
jgi:RecA-family ATPase